MMNYHMMWLYGEKKKQASQTKRRTCAENSLSRQDLDRQALANNSHSSRESNGRPSAGPDSGGTYYLQKNVEPPMEMENSTPDLQLCRAIRFATRSPETLAIDLEDRATSESTEGVFRRLACRIPEASGSLFDQHHSPRLRV
jgi:hypothetical protein